jgi:hypothetical protein
MSYEQTIDSFLWQFEPTLEPVESVPQIPHEGDYSNSEKFEKLSRGQLLATPDDSLAREFKECTMKWKRETGFHSSLSKKFTHPDYQRIMAMGKPALPFILRELRDELDHWFYALELITGNEAKDVAAGVNNLDDARSAWLEWGYKNGYL